MEKQKLIDMVKEIVDIYEYRNKCIDISTFTQDELLADVQIIQQELKHQLITNIENLANSIKAQNTKNEENNGYYD